MEYTELKNTYFATPKGDPKDLISLEIGDSKQVKFLPQLKIMRWDNEVNFSARLVHNEKNPVVSKVGEKIFWKGDKVEGHFYEVPDGANCPEGGYEFEVILKGKPATNKIEFTLQTKELNFFYQPPLTEEFKVGDTLFDIQIGEVTETDVFDTEGRSFNHRPEKVVGSYEVYHKTKGVVNIEGSKDYKCGKVFSIYRPKIIDAKGNWIWGGLNVDISTGLLTITIPQGFLDSAVYPVSIDPDFGYTSQGGSNTTSSANWMFGVQYDSPSDTSTGASMKAFTGGGGNIAKGVLVLVATIVANGVGGANDAGTPIVSTFATPPTITPSTTYMLSFVYSTTNTVYYTASGAQGKYHLANNYTTPTNPTWTNIGYQFSIYCSYNAGAAPAVTDRFFSFFP